MTRRAFAERVGYFYKSNEWQIGNRSKLSTSSAADVCLFINCFRCSIEPVFFRNSHSHLRVTKDTYILSRRKWHKPQIIVHIHLNCKRKMSFIRMQMKREERKIDSTHKTKVYIQQLQCVMLCVFLQSNIDLECNSTIKMIELNWNA